MASVIILVVTLLASQGAPPAPASKGRAVTSSSQQQNTPANPAGTPPPTTVTVTMPKPDAAQLEQERKDRERQMAMQEQVGRFTGLLVLVGAIQVIAAGIASYYTARAANAAKRSADAAHASSEAMKDQLKFAAAQIDQMERISGGQTADMRASITEATRAADAMQTVAASLVQSAAGLSTSIEISREAADRQRLVTELAGRAYLSVLFDDAVYQDDTHIFEAGAIIVNKGSTPAYDVTFKSAAAIVPLPLPDDFAYPFTDANVGTSLSLIAPGLTRVMRRTVDGRVPDDQVETIKRGHGQCLLMWGRVDYRDAFREARFINFAFTIRWLPWAAGKGLDSAGNPLPERMMSHDTARHNDAN
jgi:hypothetical protein